MKIAKVYAASQNIASPPLGQKVGI